MTPRSCYFEGTLDALLPFYLSKIQIEGVLLFVEFLTGVYNRWLVFLFFAIKE